MPSISVGPSVRFECPNPECMAEVWEYITDCPAQNEHGDTDPKGVKVQRIMCQHCNNYVDLSIYYSDSTLCADIEGSATDVNVIDPPDSDDNFDEDDAYEDYILLNTPQDPLSIYQDAVFDTDDLIADVGRLPYRSAAFSRMIFTQYFSMIEAYLYDKLISIIKTDNEALIKLVDKNTEWEKSSVRIKDIVNKPDFLQTWIQTELKKTLFHNFIKVDHYYKGALGISIFPDNDIKVRLLRATPIRHDCVHRNGRDQDGEKRDITIGDLDTLKTDIDSVVRHIESIIAARRSN